MIDLMEPKGLVNIKALRQAEDVFLAMCGFIAVYVGMDVLYLYL
jgi:hypothetical protein